MQTPRNSYRNILIIKPGAVGDLLQMTPVIRALRKHSPDSAITLMVGFGTTAALFKNDPQVSETIVFDRDGAHRSLPALFELWRSLHSRRFDLILNFQRSNLKAWFLASAAFPCRVLVYHKAKNRTAHAVVNYLETLAPLGISTADQALKLYLDDRSRAFAQELFSVHGLDTMPVIALNPGATHAVNRWPAARFAELADLIAERHSARTIIVGGPGDVPLAEDILSLSRSKPLSVAGRTDLLQLGAVLERCRVLVSGDTGPLHMATAVGTKTIALFGAADPERTGPVGSIHVVIQATGVACIPCRSRTCGNAVYLECMDKISAVKVADAIAAIMH